LGSSGTDLLSFRLLVPRSLLAAPIGQQTDFFRTDLGSTQPLEQGGSYTIGLRAPCQHGGLLQGDTDRSSLQLGEQRVGWTASTQASLTAKAPSRHLDASELGGKDAACRSLQPTLRCATVWACRVLIFPVSDGLFHGLTHGLLTCPLNVLFHLG
jgi:hypothetical protein